MVKNRTADVLQQSRDALNVYANRFDNAVSMITNALDNLNVISESIDQKVEEIDSYTNALKETKAGLEKEKNKNNAVIKNLKTLLCID